LCPTGQGNKSQPKGKMEFSQFKKIIDELGDYLYEIDLFNWGEPFLNKEIYKMIKYSKDKNIKVNISSNLSSIDQKDAEKIVDSGLSRLIVSLDGASQESLNKYRSGADFEKIISNIKAIKKEKYRKKRKEPKIIWQFLVMRQNENEIGKARKMAKQLGIEIEFRPVRTDLGKEIFENDKTKVEKYRKWLPSKETYSRFNYRKKKKKAKIKTCMFLWTQSTISWNGAVYPCCAVYDYKYNFGNMFKDKFMSIWNNKKYQEARKIVRTKKVTNPSIVCAPCMLNGFIDY
jgi:radical SAM protein with 4Fe4S-binding SPASM domain